MTFDFSTPPSDFPALPVMTLRDYFAAKAMAAGLGGILSAGFSVKDGDQIEIAKRAYGMADAMLKAREA